MSKRPLRVAHVFPVLASGGLWRHAANLVQLSPVDCESTVISIFHDPRGPGQALPRRLPLVSLGLDPATYRDRSGISARVLEALQALKPDVVHSYHYFTDLYAIPAAARAGVAAVRSVHGILQLAESDGFQKTFVRHEWTSGEIAEELRIEPSCQMTIVVASYLARQLARYGFPEKKINILLDGVDGTYFSEGFRRRARRLARRSLGLSDDVTVIGFIGRLEPAKNPLMLLDVFARLGRSSRIHFVIVGDGPLAVAFSARLADLGARASFTWLQPTKHIRLAYAAFDILLMTSLTEGCPNVALEAMAQAIPVVAPAVGGLPEILTDALDPFLFPSGDADGAASRLESLVSGRRHLASVGAECRSVALAKFGLEARQQRLLALYRRAAEAGIAEPDTRKSGATTAPPDNSAGNGPH